MNDLSLMPSENQQNKETLPEVITSAPFEVQQTIINLCAKIDHEQHKIRFAAIEMGKALHEIREMVKMECRAAKGKARENGESTVGIIGKPVFEELINIRFNKGVDWANRLILIYHHFNEDDPLLECCTTLHLLTIKRLEDNQIDTTTIKQRLLNGEKLSVSEINNIANAISKSSETENVVQETSDKLIQLQNKIERAEKELERNKSEQKLLQDEINAKANTNESLILQLREKQQVETNNSLESRRQLEALKLQLKNMEDELNKAKSSTTKVEIDVVPAGFTSIEEAIRLKQEELDRISEEVANSKETLLKKEAATKLFGDLHESFSTMSLRVYETLNKTSQIDIEENKDLISKIVQMLSTTQNALLQVA